MLSPGKLITPFKLYDTYARSIMLMKAVGLYLVANGPFVWYLGAA